MFLRGVPTESPSGSTEDHKFSIDTRVVQGVVMSPQHAKATLRALERNIEEYEAQHGEIPVIEAPSTAALQASSIDPAQTDSESNG